MDRLKELSLGRQIALGAGILLLIDSFLDWQQVSAGGFSVGQSAWHGFWGIVMCLALIVLLVWVAIKAFGIAVPVELPEGLLTLGLAALILVFAVIKALADSYVHWPAYLGIVLAAGLAYGAWLIFQDTGEALPQMPKTTSTNASTPPAAAQPEDPAE